MVFSQERQELCFPCWLLWSHFTTVLDSAHHLNFSSRQPCGISQKYQILAYPGLTQLHRPGQKSVSHYTGPGKEDGMTCLQKMWRKPKRPCKIPTSLTSLSDFYFYLGKKNKQINKIYIVESCGLLKLQCKILCYLGYNTEISTCG